MKSIYYNWKKHKDTQKNTITDEEAWGQFVDLEINDYCNIKRKINKHTNLIRYEPSLLTIQENNVVNIQSKVIIYDSSYMLILSMSVLGLYTLVQIFMQYIAKYHG
jgi:hypothetical protein